MGRVPGGDLKSAWPDDATPDGAGANGEARGARAGFF